MSYENESDIFLKADALISYYLNIPFPEQLPDDIWVMKLAQVTWLAEKGLLNLKFQKSE
ncbi:hypothetical protein ACQ1P2_02830 [Ornithobacterium rhinotracheale]|uniref:hypothetical protein n=1 Tax=Ornithobacterium rhinotracheale TaxID=28251 RepID=UPI001FF1CCC9|nr:hypothetical protein [Ornithobacterium rhinotracheale]MCK0199234.1 hypothetical protein [Ornithobacterium rhinotracheale]MCK0200257.1 hypothetical protein [Ornithobacterium rhinotracheale]MCK0200547.1 hypothetical protein [Ornithobacterium rhinotracheale]